jgi:hypothetical protein
MQVGKRRSESLAKLNFPLTKVADEKKVENLKFLPLKQFERMAANEWERNKFCERQRTKPKSLLFFPLKK